MKQNGTKWKKNGKNRKKRKNSSKNQEKLWKKGTKIVQKSKSIGGTLIFFWNTCWVNVPRLNILKLNKLTEGSHRGKQECSEKQVCLLDKQTLEWNSLRNTEHSIVLNAKRLNCSVKNSSKDLVSQRVLLH